ncbi:MAG TPA: GNAT family N-acetyltransferase [Solirubrobacteraceae bacterium]|nr:GNAT family N-acetyltransferase [Solirubrobacteraceae bacterium]
MTAPPPLRTPRLTLDAWVQSDLKLLGDLARTPAVMRYIGDGTIWSDARIADVGAHVVDHWHRHGFGWRVARAEGAAVGLIALNYAGEGAGIDSGEHEIGWWLAPSAWGRGLAREGAAAVRDEAFERVSAPSIVARIQPANAGSLAVAAAIGLDHETESIGRGGEPIAVLRLTVDRWRDRISPTDPGSPPAAPPGAPA